MPHAVRGRARYRRILRFAAWHFLRTWWYEGVLPRIGLARVADRSREARLQAFASRFRVLAVELGGLMIKLGQFLSTRLDVLPPEFTKELEDLQDEVPAERFADIRALAEAQLGVPLDRVYAEFDEEPVAAASLGQAHRARLAGDDARRAGFAKVIVKVQRPGIAEVVAVDLAALRRVGGWAMRFRAVRDRVDMHALIGEFATASLKEIDYLNEGANAERFRDSFAVDARVRVPDVVWERTTRQVLTLEDVSAIKITDGHGLRAAGIDSADVAKAFADVMFDQLFTHGFFHADPHPGNLFITPHPGEDPAWTLTFVDFGMMGEVPDRLRGALRALIIAAAARNGQGMVDAMDDAGVLLPSADRVELERVVSQVFARFGGMGLGELKGLDASEFRAFAEEFSDVLLEMPFQLPEDFLLIIRAVSLTSGLCTSLDPAYNAWDSVEPYAQHLLREEGRNVLGDVAREARDLAQIALRAPRRLDGALARVESGDLAVHVPRVEALVERAERGVRRLTSAVIFGGMIFGGAWLRPDEPGLGSALMIASAVPLLHAVFGARRSR
ncbi:ABC1 kinase family protein [Demequina pelophila]|uniref:ABC1 kinase family protein n=1 Tax=Demequina pelophila TaxID=1638984 RepID=UPI000783A8FB|nr:AarF/UbiB family protein [Demequina pelophila]